jgi:hypothetical protein
VRAFGPHLKATLSAGAAALRAVPLLFWAFVALCVVELWLLQGATLQPAFAHPPLNAAIKSALRLFLDLACVGGLLLLMPRPVRVVFAAALTLWGVASTLYVAHYDDALNPWAIGTTWREGGALAGDIGGLLKAPQFALLAVLPLKALLWWKMPPFPSPRVVGGAAVAAWLGAVLALNVVTPLAGVAGADTFGALGTLYGTTPPSVATLVFLDNDEVLARALARRDPGPDPAPAPLSLPPSPRVLFVQLESFDDEALDAVVGGAPVMPFLREQAARAVRLAVLAPHGRGSSDADVMALTGFRPSADVPTYKIAGYPFDDALPARLARRGVSSGAFHGVSGAFYARRAAYQRMGFTTLSFREELEAKRPGARVAGLGLDDDVVFRAAAEFLRASPLAFALVITASSHTPFTAAPVLATRPWPSPRTDRQRLENALHYVDASLGDLVEGLPADTLVVVYGDHHSGVENAAGIVPEPRVGFLVFRRDVDLSAQGAPTAEPVGLVHALRRVHAALAFTAE